MANIEITKTELVWPGKYKEDGTLKEVPRVSLPFQVIETVNESKATRDVQKAASLGLFKAYDGSEGDSFEAGWRNKLIWGDNLLVMGSLLERFAGRVDLIYIDPPFATGVDFSFKATIGESDKSIIKEQSAIEEKAYRDTWHAGISSFYSMMRDRLSLMKDLLSPNGSIYVHLDYRVVHGVKLIMDDVFGADNFLNHIVWSFNTRTMTTPYFARKHNDILLYKGQSANFFDSDTVRIPHRPESLVQYDQVDEQGKRYKQQSGGARSYLNELGQPCPDVWDIQILGSRDPERTGYETQKPEKLLERIIRASCPPNGLIADFFCGSGTTLAVAEKLGHRWIGCDLGRWGVHVSRKRLLGIESCKPFEVLNLGKYERQYWQGVTFAETKRSSLAEQALYEYLAFILKLYGAQPLAGMAHLHGKKGKAMLHIGAVDAPVTITEIDAAVEECAKAKQSELHVLGWEWEMGLYDLVVDAAKKRNVKLLLLQIPREVMEQQAAAKGDVRFFELAYLEMDAKAVKPREYRIDLKKFVIPNTELIPEEVRAKVTKWSDYIDYWAVDWDFQNDTFMQGWVAYRTKQQRKLTLTSDAHVYKKPGKYQILVKVIDIFGNDTTQAVEINVK